VLPVPVQSADAILHPRLAAAAEPVGEEVHAVVFGPPPARVVLEVRDAGVGTQEEDRGQVDPAAPRFGHLEVVDGTWLGSDDLTACVRDIGRLARGRVWAAGDLQQQIPDGFLHGILHCGRR
jgi:hypothetical protein